MAKLIGTPLYTQVLTVINNKLYDLGMSVDDKKSEGSYVYIQCDGDRNDTREALEMELAQIRGVKLDRKYVKSRSSFDLTEAKGFNQVMYIAYKNQKGGMSETTLNSTITELFPAIAYEIGANTDLPPDQFYQQLLKENRPQLGAYKNVKAFDAGKEFLDKAQTSSKFEEKTTNAQAITEWLRNENKRKPIVKVVWGYRNNMKPDGVAPNHKGDILFHLPRLVYHKNPEHLF